MKGLYYYKTFTVFRDIEEEEKDCYKRLSKASVVASQPESSPCIYSIHGQILINSTAIGPSNICLFD